MTKRMVVLVVAMSDLVGGAPAPVQGEVHAYPAAREALIWKHPDSGPPGPASLAGLMQLLPDGSRLEFIPRVAAGETRPAPEPGLRPSRTGVRWRKHQGALIAVVDGRELFTFHPETVPPPRPEVDPIFARSGFIDAIKTRAGVVVSASFPSRPPKHEHYYGLWSAWTATEFEGRALNFWDVKGGTGEIRCETVTGTWEGTLAAGFTAENVFYDRTVSPRRPALRETWNVIAYSLPADLSYDLFDVSLRQVCTTPSPVKLKEYRYSGLGMSGAEAFYESAMQVEVASGETDRVKANHTAQRWVYMGGRVNDRQAGVAILSHPKNFRAPELVRIHPTSAFFCFSPSTAGDWEITPGKPYDAHYRVVVLDGEPNRERLERLWHAFASVPPAANSTAGGN